MIKDSKIIGTKIAAPYGWKKFKVGELFNFVKSDTSGLGNFVSNDTVSLIKATSSNNGVDSVFKSYTGLCYKNILTIGMRGSFKVFLHTSPVVLGDNVAGFKLKDITYSSSNRVLLFLGCLLEKLYSYDSGYAGYPTWSKLENHDALVIPVLPNFQPDFVWMEQYMKLVQEDYLQQKKLSNQAEIKAYLTASQTDSLEITDADREFLHDFEKLPRRKFKVEDLFDIETGGDFILRDARDGNIPLISHKGDNNGISRYVSFDSDKTLYNCLNTISLADRGVFKAFVHSEDFYIGTRVKALIIKAHDVSFNVLLYFEAVINKLSKMFEDYNTNATNKLGDLILELPVLSDSHVDMHSIEKYMQIQSKLLINTVAETLAPAGATN